MSEHEAMMPLAVHNVVNSLLVYSLSLSMWIMSGCGLYNSADTRACTTKLAVCRVSMAILTICRVNTSITVATYMNA